MRLKIFFGLTQMGSDQFGTNFGINLIGSERISNTIDCYQVFYKKIENRNGYSLIQIIKNQKAEIPIPKISGDINNEEVKTVLNAVDVEKSMGNIKSFISMIILFYQNEFC